MKNVIKYIVFYDNEINEFEKRYVAQACKSKADYVMYALSTLGYKIDVISPSLSTKNNFFCKSKKYYVSNSISVKLPLSICYHGFVGKIIRKINHLFALYFFVVRNIKSGDTVLAYHSVSLSRVLRLIKKIKKIRLIMHTEEVYSDVSHNKKHRVLENKIFRISDAFIFPTIQLNNFINKNHKPFAIANGIYKPIIKVSKKYDDGRIHLAYAGTFSEEKGGLNNAIQAAKYLNNKFVLHIYGTDDEILVQKYKIIASNIEKESGCQIIFEGEKKGNEFNMEIQKCHIGLSTQNPENDFNSTSFLSKLLMYLCNGLTVISIKIPVLITSYVNNMINYYDINDANILANVIIESSKEIKSQDYCESLKKLDIDFIGQLGVLLNRLGVNNE